MSGLFRFFTRASPTVRLWSLSTAFPPASDQVHFLSGVRWGFTLGGPIVLPIPNRDWEN